VAESQGSEKTIRFWKLPAIIWVLWAKLIWLGRNNGSIFWLITSPAVPLPAVAMMPRREMAQVTPSFVVTEPGPEAP